MSELLRARQGHIETLTINRPESRNAINGALSRSFADAFEELETDDDCWVVIITGSGDKAFCAGMDLKAFAAGEVPEIMGAKGGFGGLAQRQFPKPVIAAVNGPALAGGCEIMLWCDLVVAVEGAVFGIPEVKRGLIAGAGALIRLPKRIPPAIALELALTGDLIGAQRALQLGLINRVVPADSLMEEAQALAESIAENAPIALRYTKHVMKQAGELPDAEGWAVSDAAVAAVFSSNDAMEGSLAFAERRKPKWTGT